MLLKVILLSLKPSLDAFPLRLQLGLVSPQITHSKPHSTADVDQDSGLATSNAAGFTMLHSTRVNLSATM